MSGRRKYWQNNPVSNAFLSFRKLIEMLRPDVKGDAKHDQGKAEIQGQSGSRKKN